MRREGKYDEKEQDGKYDDKNDEVLSVNVTAIDISPEGCVEITAPLNLRIQFELEREVERGYWEVQFLVDTGHKRIIKKLGKTDEDYYPDG